MKRFSILIGLLVICSILFGQNQTLPIQLQVRSDNYQLNRNVTSVLKKKLTTVLSKNDLIITEKAGTHILKAELSQLEESKAEGMKTLHIVKLQLGLSYMNSASGDIILSEEKILSGSDKNYNAAARKAAGSIRPSQKFWKNLATQITEVSSEYYAKNCKQLLAEADKAVSMNDYGKALMTLKAFPAESDCGDATSKLKSVYDAYQTKHCEQNIKNAEIELATENFKAVVYHLKMIDASSPCASKAKALVDKLASAVDETQQEQLEILENIFKTGADAERIRLETISNIVSDYVKHHH